MTMARFLSKFISKPMLFEDRLVEEESNIGGRIFKRDDSVVRQRFWYHVGDWFFERVQRTAEGDIQTVIRIQIRDNSVHKLVEGREYDLSNDELERFLTAVELYRDYIKKELYSGSRDGYRLAA